MLVEALQPERDLSRSPLFQVMFTLQNAPQEPLALPGLTLSPLEADSETAKFDLTLHVIEIEQRLEGTLEYNTDLFDAGTMDRLVVHLRVLLESIAVDAEQCISNLPLLLEAEREQLLKQWSHTGVDYTRDVCVHDLFRQQVDKTPTKVSVVWGQGELTFQELREQAHQLAHFLKRINK
jgi:non-ribosomal peptide synthetase component F